MKDNVLKTIIVLLFISLLICLSSCGDNRNLNGEYTYQGGHTTNTITISDYTSESLFASWSTYTDLDAPLKQAAGVSTKGEGSFVRMTSCPVSAFDTKDTIWYESNSYYLGIKGTNTYTFYVFYKDVSGVACYVVAKK